MRLELEQERTQSVIAAREAADSLEVKPKSIAVCACTFIRLFRIVCRGSSDSNFSVCDLLKFSMFLFGIFGDVSVNFQLQ